MPMSSAPGGRSGRRRGTTQTRDAIALAAQTQFAEAGYDRATFRSIATAAGVDPALVVHFFGSKEQLFHEVMKLPAGMADRLAGLAEVPRGEIGRRLAEVIVGGFENPATQRIIVGRIRSASQHPEAGELVRQAVAGDLARLTAALDVDQPDVRAVLAGVQVVGTALARYVVRVEPLASMPAAQLIGLLAPTFQRLLVEPLPA
jgi:AcrR family transcriptional regulator